MKKGEGLEKGMVVTEGPNGPAVELPKRLKGVHVLKSIVDQLLKEMVTEPETVDGKEVRYIYHAHLLEKLEDMGERNPKSKINQLITACYLVQRTTAPDEISYYIFEYIEHGRKFRRQHPKAA